MTERDKQSPEEIADALKSIFDRRTESIRLEVMWNPSLADPEIHLTDEELDEFLQTFSDDQSGKKFKYWISEGAHCDIQKEISGKQVACGKNAVCVIDWDGARQVESSLVCREDLRPAYSDIKSKNVRDEAMTLRVRINGKQVPRPQD